MSQVARDLAPTGRLRAAINIGNPVLARAEADGQLAGLSVELARAVGERLALPVELLPYQSAGAVVAAAEDAAWDLAFLAFDPARAQQLHFTPAYLAIDAGFLVAEAAALGDVAEIDRPEVRIASVKGAAYDLHLQRSLRHARRVEYPTPSAALEALAAEEADAAAGVSEALCAFAAARPGFRLLSGCITRVEQALAIPVGRAAAAQWLDGFVREALASGLIAGLR